MSPQHWRLSGSGKTCQCFESPAMSRRGDKLWLTTHRQRVIKFTVLTIHNSITVQADLYSYSTLRGEFFLERSEKWQISTTGNKKLQPRMILQVAVVKNCENGLRQPFIILFTGAGKTKFAVHILILNDLLPAGKQLEMLTEFRVPCDLSAVSTHSDVIDGPILTYRNEDDTLTIIPFTSQDSKIIKTQLKTKSRFIEIDNNANTAKIITSSGDLISFTIDEYLTTISKSSIVPLKFLTDNVTVISESAFLHNNNELFEFRDGKLIKSVAMNGDFIDIHNYKRFIVLSMPNGRSVAVDLKTFEIIKEWYTVCQLLIDDFTSTGSDAILLIFDSSDESLEFSQLLNQHSSITNMETIIHPKDAADEAKNENEMLSDQQITASKALEKRLNTGKSLLNETSWRTDEKSNFIRSMINGIRSMSSNGATNIPFTYPNVTDIMEQVSEPEVPLVPPRMKLLKLIKTQQRFWKQKWLLMSEIENESSKTLRDLSLILTSNEASIQSRIRFVLDPPNVQNQIEDLEHRFTTRTFFASVSPTLHPRKTLKIMAVTSLSQPLFSRIKVEVGVSVAFRDESSSILTQSCDHVTLNLAEECFKHDLDPFWAMAMTDFSVSLTIQSSITNLSRSVQILIDHLHLHPTGDALFFPHQHPLSEVWLQTDAHARNKSEIRIHYNSEGEVLLLLHLMYNTFPPDVLIVPSSGDVNSLTSALQDSLKKELDLIRQIMSIQTSLPPKLEFGDLKDAASLNLIRQAFAERQKWLKENQNGEITVDVYKELKNKLTKIENETDVFVGFISECIANTID